MKRIIALCFAVISWVSLAQTVQLPTGTLTSPNLIYTTKNPYQGPTGTEPYTWSGFTNTQSTGGGTSGGSQPGYNSSTGVFMFGYTQSTIAYTYALNTALKNSGMSWLGYNYSWEYINQDYTRGTLSAKINFAADDGTSMFSRSYTMGKTTEGWTTFAGSETFPSALSVLPMKNFSLNFIGTDDRYWAGYYGPQVRNPSVSILYTFDQCSSNPLSSPNCPGYAQAYHDQQCTANPLYATDCPGYAVAYQTQQCNINPLYSPQCPGYAEAYKTQQCSLNALYATDCPGYEQAYFNQQCLKDSLYSNKCEGYATAYAIKYLVTLDPAVTTAVNQQLTTTNEIAKNDPAKVTVVNSTVDTVLATPSTTSATSVTSVTSVIIPPPAPGTSPIANAASTASTTPPPTQAQQQEKQQDQKKTDSAVASVERKAGGDKKEAGKQVAAAAKDAAEKAKNATTMEAQTATQGLVVGLMGYVPGFTAYQNSIVPDINQITMARQYSKPNVDNASIQRRLNGANENKWREMVDSQYKTGN